MSAADRDGLFAIGTPVALARPRIFNVPAVVAGLAAVLCVIHVMMAFVLSSNAREAALELFAFDPVRHQAASLGVPWPGGWAAEVWTFVTYAFLHVNLPHLVFNLIWLIVFATPVARRFGATRFLVFFAFTAAGGALAHLVSHLDQNVPVIGASAAVLGMMAAAMRFIFQPGGPLGRPRLPEEETYRVAAKPLGAMLRDPRVILFVLIWFGLNGLLALPELAMPGIEGNIAWQAHIGGFVAGLLGFAAFDPAQSFPKTGEGPLENERASQDEPSALP
jgi:membrane associated rhomboid family serine protease